MSPEEIMSQASSPGPTRTSRKKILIYGGIIAILLIIIISVSVVVAKNNQENAQIAALRNLITEALVKENIDASGLHDGNTPQGKAFNWLYFSNPNVNSMERTLVLQRYALAAFYYSTYQVVNLYTPNPPIWASSYNWLTTADVCEWEGVQCTNRKRVNGISLESNSLTGKIPGDLVLLREHLVTLDLTTNFLYMEPADYKFFSSLTLLQTLLLDDNYLLTDGGLPSELGACTDLVWIRMSYNLLVGELSNDLFKNLTKLTHLEVESNFLTGTMPSAVGHLEELIYLYMRRNSMVYNLDFIKTNKMKNLCKFWNWVPLWDQFLIFRTLSHSHMYVPHFFTQSPCGWMPTH